MKKLLIVLCFLWQSHLNSQAQSLGPAVLNTTGGSTVLAGNTYEYAIGGVPAGNTYDGPGLVITQGVLQPMVEDPSNAGQLAINCVSLLVFPNPAEQTLFLQPYFKKGGVLEYAIADIMGRTLLQKEVVLELGNERQEIHMQHLAAATYSLRVIWKQEGKTYLNTYKIQKIK